jgi:FkbM family methyltransferase
MGDRMSNAMRRYAMRLTRGLVFKRKLPVEFTKAPILVSSDGGLRYLFKRTRNIDPALLHLAVEFGKQESTVWDIGANLGYFTFAVAARIGAKGQVLAIEPDPWLVALLRRSASIQPQTSAAVDVIPAAAANRLDIRTFYVSDFARSTSHLKGFGGPLASVARSEQNVLTVSLDWLAERYPAPQLLKIDVEGAEVEVLQGALDLISTNRPIVICEVSSENTRDFLSIMKRLNYKLYDAEVPSEKRLSLSQPAWNTLALPS